MPRWGAFTPPLLLLQIVYLAPLRALVAERLEDWQARFGSMLGLSCLELSGDSEPEPAQLEAADIITTTPEKFGRRRLRQGDGIREWVAPGDHTA